MDNLKVPLIIFAVVVFAPAIFLVLASMPNLPTMFLQPAAHPQSVEAAFRLLGQQAAESERRSLTESWRAATPAQREVLSRAYFVYRQRPHNVGPDGSRAAEAAQREHAAAITAAKSQIEGSEVRDWVCTSRNQYRQDESARRNMRSSPDPKEHGISVWCREGISVTIHASIAEKLDTIYVNDRLIFSGRVVHFKDPVTSSFVFPFFFVRASEVRLVPTS